MELVKAEAELDLQNMVITALTIPVFSLIISVFNPIVSTQDGDSAVVLAVIKGEPAILRELVRAGSDLNLQNQVRRT